MSHFICPECGAECIDSPKGYIRGCEHYPAEIYETALSRLQARMRKIERETNSKPESLKDD